MQIRLGDRVFYPWFEKRPDEATEQFEERLSAMNRREEVWNAKAQAEAQRQLEKHRAELLEPIPILPRMKQELVETGRLRAGGSDAVGIVDRFMASDLRKDFRPVLVLAGPIGDGKTCAACAALVKVGQGRFLKSGQLVIVMRPHSTNSEIQRQLETTALVVVDDVGTVRDADAERLALHELIDTRLSSYNRRTILTTNLTPAQLSAYLDARTVDRLRELTFWGLVRRTKSLRQGRIPGVG